MIFNHKERKEIYGEMDRHPSELWWAVMMLIATGIVMLLPFCVSEKPAEKKVEVLKESRVYNSKDAYDKFVEENP